MTTETEALREQFEAWARKNELEAERHKYADDQYDDHAATSAWWAGRDAFQAGHAAAKAEAVDVGEPYATHVVTTTASGRDQIETWKTNARFDSPDRSIDLYTADQLAAAVAAERERAATVCERIADDYNEREGFKYAELRTDAQTGAEECADAIRAGAKEPSDA